jgi:hypothetical protein
MKAAVGKSTGGIWKNGFEVWWGRMLTNRRNPSGGDMFRVRGNFYLDLTLYIAICPIDIETPIAATQSIRRGCVDWRDVLCPVGRVRLKPTWAPWTPCCASAGSDTKQPIETYKDWLLPWSSSHPRNRSYFMSFVLITSTSNQV